MLIVRSGVVQGCASRPSGHRPEKLFPQHELRTTVLNNLNNADILVLTAICDLQLGSVHSRYMLISSATENLPGKLLTAVGLVLGRELSAGVDVICLTHGSV